MPAGFMNAACFLVKTVLSEDLRFVLQEVTLLIPVSSLGPDDLESPQAVVYIAVS